MGAEFRNPGVSDSQGGRPVFPRFETSTRQRGLFWSNLHDFLYERPVKGANNGSYLAPVEYGSGFFSNLLEWFRPGLRRGPKSSLLIEERPWYRAFIDNIREAIHLAGVHPGPLDRPIEVGELWNPPRKYGHVKLLSFIVHAILALLILVPLFPRLTEPAVQPSTNFVPIDFSPYLPPAPAAKKAGGGGGGGVHDPIPATKGRLPQFSRTQFAPPMVKINPKPLIQVPASVLGSPDIKLPNPNLPNYGDPIAKLLNDSAGPGEGGSIGTGTGTGVGSGTGSGVGPGYGYNTGGGYPSAGKGGYGMPVCMYCPLPRFSDEAVKVKYQGTVLLQCVVTKDGRAENIQVVRSLGMGLDQKAIAALRTWRFKPALGPSGQPSAVVVIVEVNFQLL